MHIQPSLKVAWRILRSLREQVKDPEAYVVHKDIVLEIERILKDISEVKPGLLQPFYALHYYSHGDYYRKEGLLTRLNTDLAFLEAEQESDAPAAFVSTEDFAFAHDEALRKIIVRDYKQLEKVLATEAWKAVIVLCGGLIEGLLLDLLERDATAARQSVKAPKEGNLRRWDLNDLINVAADLKKLPTGIDRLSHSVREYRNLVHPGRELSSDLRVEPEEARIAVEVLRIVVRELKQVGA